ncbi:MAG: hypothetical protein QGG48_04165 [Desulfatiglandales bacterium]|nr:hypothetical protein [Desulfatiglandales bacterium]
MGVAILFNMDVWNKLSKNIQEKLMNLTIAFEKDMEISTRGMMKAGFSQWGVIMLAGLEETSQKVSRLINSLNLQLC